MHPYVIGIAGPSGSGKTTLARHLAEVLGEATIFSLDHYYRDLSELSFEERCAFNFDHPESLESQMLIGHITDLAHGRDILRPIYHFPTHSRLEETERVACGPYLIVEGLFTLHWEALRPLYHTSVYMELDDETCYRRRLARDVAERGRSPESVKKQYDETVRPMAFEFIRPTKEYAHLVVPGDEPIQDTVVTVMADIRAKCGAMEPSAR